MAFQILSFGTGCPSALVRCLKMPCSIHIYIPPSRSPILTGRFGVAGWRWGGLGASRAWQGYSKGAALSSSGWAAEKATRESRAPKGSPYRRPGCWARLGAQAGGFSNFSRPTSGLHVLFLALILTSSEEVLEATPVPSSL